MSVFSFVNEPESASVARELALKEKEKQALIEKTKADEDRVRAIAKEIEDIRREAQEKINALATERIELEEKLREFRFDIKSLEREIFELEKRLRLLRDRERKQDEFAARALEFDRITAGLYWREWAKSHQIDGARHMANAQRSILADKMGLGKTLTVLIAADMLKAQRILIVAPADVVKNFEKEVRFWAPHRKTVLSMYRMTKSERNAAFELFKLVPQSDYVVLINYEAWRKDAHLIEQLSELRFDTVIMDEAHNIKNVKSVAYTGLEKLIFKENACPLCSGRIFEEKIDKFQYKRVCSNCGLSISNGEWKADALRSVKNIFPMTGTPILNRPDELFPLLHLILPEVFYDIEVFRSLYCTQDFYTGKWKFQNGAMDRLAHHLQGRYIMRNRNDAGVELPKQDVVIHEIPVSEVQEGYPTQWRLMEMLSKRAQIILESGKTMTPLAAITMILRKRQINVYPAGVELKDSEGNVVFSVGDETTESIKLDKAFDLLTEITSDGFESGERAVVFSQFKAPLHALCKRLQEAGIRAVVLDGETPEYLREEIKADFDRKVNCARKWQVVLANYKVGGVGLNFTEATHILALDEEWNPGKNEQAWARIDRVGQTEETTVHILRIVGTVDTWMANLIQDKARIVEGLESAAMDILEAMRNGDIL